MDYIWAHGLVVNFQSLCYSLTIKHCTIFIFPLAGSRAASSSNSCTLSSMATMQERDHKMIYKNSPHKYKCHNTKEWKNAKNLMTCENVFRTVTVAAVCVAGAGYMMLFLIGIAAGIMALCSGALAVPLLSEVMCWLHGVLTFYHRATSVWRAIIHLTGLWVVQFIRVSYTSCQLSVQTWALSLPFLYPGHTETPEHYLIVLTNFCWCICFTFILPHDNNFSV